MTAPELSALPGIVLHEDEPIFNEPWEAQAFAMVINLHQHGAFQWDEWANALSNEIHSGEERSYYQHWLAALEKIVAMKKITSVDDLNACKTAWKAAAAATPHGEPIELSAGLID